MTTLIIDKKTVGIPGTVTPAVQALRDQAIAARDQAEVFSATTEALQQEAVANIINGAGVGTDSLTAAIVDGSGQINAARYAIPADADDISLALRRPCLAAAPFGASVYLPDGDYMAKTTLEVGDIGDVRITLARDARVTVLFDGTFFRVGPPTWQAVQSCTPPAAGAYWTDRMIVGVTSAAAYTVGDIVRIVADGKEPSTRATPGDGTDYRIGQYAVIVSVDTTANTLSLDRPLEADYVWATNPRIGRLPRRRVRWTGGNTGYERGHEATWHGQAMICYGVSDLEIDVEIEHAYNKAIRPVGCFRPRISASGGEMTNNEPNQQFGYLVDDASEYAEVYVRAGRNRRGYTTSMSLVEAGSSSLHLYGETREAVVDGRSNGNSQAGFDTHHGSAGVTFRNVVVSGGVQGGGRVVLRGRNHRVVSPILLSGKDGIYVYSEPGVDSPTTGVEIIDAKVDVDRYPLQLENASATIKGATSLLGRKYGRVANMVGATLTLSGEVRLRPRVSAGVDSRRTITARDATVDATGATVIFDLRIFPHSAQLRLHPGRRYRLRRMDRRTHHAERREPDVRVLEEERRHWAHEVGGNGLEIETSKLGANPGTNMDITGAAGVGFTLPWTWRHLAGGGTGFITRTVSSDSYALAWYTHDNDRVVVRLFVSTTPRLLGALPVGTKVGQIMHLSVTLAGGATLTLKHGSTYKTALKNGSDIVFNTAETGVTPIWTGAEWSSITL